MSTFDPVAPQLAGPRLLRQDWTRLTFIHWAVDPERVAHLLPPGTRPDTLDGATYVGLIPFEMRAAGFGRGPAVPYFGDFAETNVRLYTVDDEGHRGIVFRSLETSRLLVVLTARIASATPYMWARMRIRQDGDRIEYVTRRRWPGPRGVGGRIVATLGDPIERPSALEEFVTARFGLHTRYLGRTVWIPNHHVPWSLREATLDVLDDNLVAAAGVPGLALRQPDSVVHADRVHTEFRTASVIRSR
ncbi:YqjF family protein [Aeromicrobium chenweiae]|uniref:Uncharacterized protein n=1 Tax=Aeromicrobium chenweiae TaxID=2079793 RepID=A0A2S0WP48_9ACTN|nr:DUF2071 domain-containing protein [Aeromicrobium chenweiae]AWB93050.1 hypothetical protein C3E78_13000 [Aeromicrobium chenweiae]TGN34039.1 DUF2071 domain-containing protein [Aeromicrobium chenweiae]